VGGLLISCVICQGVSAKMKLKHQHQEKWMCGSLLSLLQFGFWLALFLQNNATEVLRVSPFLFLLIQQATSEPNK
jgi:hypothetical protein